MALFTTILLAGDRENDLLAGVAPGGRKALLPIDGQPMLQRVLETVLAANVTSRIVIAANRVGDLSNNPTVATSLSKVSVPIAFHEGGRGPAASVIKCIEELGITEPLLVVTADNPLLSAAMLQGFCQGAEKANADVAVGLVKESVFRPVFPDVRRTFVRLRGEGYKGCNLFTLRAGQGKKAAVVWREIELERKRPWRLIAYFGIGTLLRAATGRLDLDGALAAVSRRMGLTVAPVIVSDPRAGMDVDTPDHAKAVEAELQRARV